MLACPQGGSVIRIFTTCPLPVSGNSACHRLSRFHDRSPILFLSIACLLDILNENNYHLLNIKGKETGDEASESGWANPVGWQDGL